MPVAAGILEVVEREQFAQTTLEAEGDLLGGPGGLGARPPLQPGADDIALEGHFVTEKNVSKVAVCLPILASISRSISCTH